ncbi:MAG: ABC transporter ATP-binding protein [Planctomycetota bacterium]|nr:MAG: ABC transporter ATP-binding protein [Planctomycetota bacterium]
MARRDDTTSHDDDRIGQAVFDAEIARRLARYLRPHRRLVLVAALATLLLACAQGLSPYLLGLAVDRGIVGRDGTLLWWLGGSVLGLELLAFGLAFAQLWLLQWLGQHIMVALRAELMDKLAAQSLSFFQRQPVGRLVTRVTNDVGAIAELFSTGLVTVVGDLLAIAIAVGFLLWLDLRLALLTFAVLPVIVAATWILKGRIRTAFRAVRRRLARLNALLAETIGGMRVVQALSAELPVFDRFAERNDEHLHAALGAVHHNALYASSVTALTGLAVGVLLGYGGERVLAAELQVGVLVAVVTYAQRLYLPIRDIAEKYTLFQSAMAGAERVFGVLDAPIEVRDPPTPRALPEPPRGEIEFDHVSFRYPPRGRPERGTEQGSERARRVYAIEDVSFRVAPGERIGIVGHTGAGKSTLIHLLARSYDVTAGAVRVDGIDVRELPQRALRRRIGVVYQDVFIFSGTVLDNIRMGTASIDRAAAERAARAVGAHPWIEALPQGYDTPLPERGATLSVGQKQLLSFARALAHDPPILVLDEATASIDPETEAALQRAIERLTAGRSSIVIAHRLATLRHVDRILVLHEGRLVEEGGWDELLERRGRFYTLHRLHGRG